MGFKKQNVEIAKLGITIPKAYAQISFFHVNRLGKCIADFKIQTSRENMDKEALYVETIELDIDKDLPIYKQVYEYAKTVLFTDWEDDIVEE